MLLDTLVKTDGFIVYGWDKNYPEVTDCAYVYTETTHIPDTDLIKEISESVDYKFTFNAFQEQGHKYWTVYVLGTDTEVAKTLPAMEADLRLIALEDDIAEIYPTQQVFNDEVEVEPTTEVPTYDVEFVDAVEV